MWHITHTVIVISASSTYVGYWIVPPEKPVGAVALQIWGDDENMRPRKKALIKFDNNVAHSCYQDGFQVEQPQDANQVLGPPGTAWIEFVSHFRFIFL